MKIYAENISKKYGKKIALKNLNFEFNECIYGLMGPNGSGKTTLIRIMTHLLSPTTGQILYENDENQISYKNLNIGYLSQSFNTFKDLTVFEQLKYFAVLKKIDRSKQNDEIHRVLELVHLLDQQNTRCKNLSGGMIRRVGIAQALLGKPQFIIFDEPTVGLDPDERIRFKEIIRNLKLDIPIILSTHIIEDISSLCTHVIFLKEGTIKFHGTTTNLFALIKDKVYQCDQEDLSKIKEKVVTTHIENNIYKVISLIELDYNFLKSIDASIEDAYFYLSQGDYDDQT